MAVNFLGVSMKTKFLPLSLITVLMATGCSAPTPEAKYDEVELMVYEKCISAFMDTLTNRQNNNLEYLTNLPYHLGIAQKECKELKPIKK
jgi:hypothetical protein